MVADADGPAPLELPDWAAGLLGVGRFTGRPMAKHMRQPITPPMFDRWLFFTAAPLHDKQGRIVGAIETLQDITERKQMEDSLRGSELRYGFVHLGGAANRIALLGPYGNSLYLDFDRRLVIALFASYPMEYSPSLMATLEQLWEAVGAATQPAKKR